MVRPPTQSPVPNVEVRIELPAGLDPQLTLNLEGKQVEGGSSGYIELLDHQGLALGRTNFSGLIGTFTLDRLGYSQNSGVVTFFVKQPLTVSSPRSKTLADVNGKPDNRIVATVNLHDVLVSDEVKVLVVRERDFFDSVNSLQHLRGAGAAQAVYLGGTGASGVMSLADGKNFTMRYIELAEMESIIEKDSFGGMSDELKTLAKMFIRSYLYKHRPLPYPENPTSFQAGLYRDYVTGNYVLAIRGTELNQTIQLVADWIVNAVQGLTGDDESYEAGILLTWAIHSLDLMNSRGLRLTGHSMGGGIASAASIANNISADVFNGAGIHPRSIVQDDGSPIVPGGAVPNLGSANALISHYYVAMRPDLSIGGISQNTPDILTFMSTYVAAMPAPNGNLIALEGLQNLKHPDLVESGKAVLASIPENPLQMLPGTAILLTRHFVADFLDMIASHSLDNVFFGLLHYDDANPNYWNAYDETDPRLR